MKTIVIDNASNLPLVPIGNIVEFQGDLKNEPDNKSFMKLVDSILKHGLFIAKAVFVEDGIIYTEDGHQTLKALNYLKSIGYETCEVITYKLEDGRMVEDERVEYQEIMIPCQYVVPVGETKERRLMDAAEKLLQINSRYAKFNEDASWFDELGFDEESFDSLLVSVNIEELLASDPFQSEEDGFEKDFAETTNDNVPMPIVSKFSEKYAAVIIICTTETEISFVKTALDIRREQTYSEAKKFGDGMVITAGRFAELWKGRE